MELSVTYEELLGQQNKTNQSPKINQQTKPFSEPPKTPTLLSQVRALYLLTFHNIRKQDCGHKSILEKEQKVLPILEPETLWKTRAAYPRKMSLATQEGCKIILKYIFFCFHTLP